MEKFSILLILLSVFLSSPYGMLNAQRSTNKTYIERDSPRWKQFYLDGKPERKADVWYLPFDVKNRESIKGISLVSKFGDHRDTYLKNHIHTAIDVIPGGRFSPVYVYPMANGVVCSIHLGDPHRTIVIKHQLPNNTVVYTSYKHLAEIFVNTGMQVDPKTKLARLYTKEEAKKQHGNFDHLHLEIRKSFTDFGCASWLTFTDEELNHYFYNPIQFLKEHLVVLKSKNIKKK